MFKPLSMQVTVFPGISHLGCKISSNAEIAIKPYDRLDKSFSSIDEFINETFFFSSKEGTKSEDKKVKIFVCSY